MNEILVTNREGSSKRDERLLRVIGYAQALADMLGLGDLREKVAQVEDDKGVLNVSWFNKPEPMEMQVLNRAWASCVGDGADDVEHYYEGSSV
ncbi:hypothetical protein QN096_11545 [Metapseudomonas otitidis]|uniref:hypothetical protein n=1 Tax=Metapseudomonas otitidis TaxID=319939 RepID=UPI0025419C79|nr:hypothetical protein [Pseudomonas otitidis]WIF69735.1 hypothetical protein QN096_11545 [Pseudomonas otitidis]